MTGSFLSVLFLQGCRAGVFPKKTAPSNPEDAVFLISETLLDLCLLAHAVTQVIKLCSADFALANRRHRDDGRRMNRKDLLTANAVGNAANCNRLADAAVLSGNDRAFESLRTFTVTFLDLYKNTDSVAHIHFR